MQNLTTDFSLNLGDCPLQEYPRPQYKRESYLNLNGLWEYCIIKFGEQVNYSGEILVPFSPESELSRVGRTLEADEELWYKREFLIADGFNKGRILLNFGAVDQTAEVYVNGKYVGGNVGGYYPFAFDITEYAVLGVNELKVKVTDESDTSYHETGKQRSVRGGIWYRRTSGIWQTVWIESVPQEYLESVKITPYLFEKRVNFELSRVGGEKITEITLIMDGKEIKTEKYYGDVFDMEIEDVRPWSPETPYLYDLKIVYGEDTVYSYFALRSVEIKEASDNYKRIYLNGKPYFMNGLLDQGYISDGIYTYPTDEALEYDIKVSKELGFNTLRKHIKIEPLRWYYHCDRLGMLVWQDMISGGEKYNPLVTVAMQFFKTDLKDNKYKLFGRSNKEGREEFYSGLNRMIKHLYNSPSIVLWTPFNEGWGQFDAAACYNMVKELDETRLIDHASGWHDQGAGDFYSRHIYFRKVKNQKDKLKRAFILSEFGGYSYKIDEHSFNLDKTFGYKLFTDKNKFDEAYQELFMTDVVGNIKNGLSASIYTEVSDVEDETNGLMTFDRKVIKANKEICLKIADAINKEYDKLK